MSKLLFLGKILETLKFKIPAGNVFPTTEICVVLVLASKARQSCYLPKKGYIVVENLLLKRE